MKTAEEIRATILLILDYIRSGKCHPNDLGAALGTVEGMSWVLGEDSGDPTTPNPTDWRLRELQAINRVN